MTFTFLTWDAPAVFKFKLFNLLTKVVVVSCIVLFCLFVRFIFFCICPKIIKIISEFERDVAKVSRLCMFQLAIYRTYITLTSII